jgi:hypothetical protein
LQVVKLEMENAALKQTDTRLEALEAKLAH